MKCFHEIDKATTRAGVDVRRRGAPRAPSVDRELTPKRAPTARSWGSRPRAGSRERGREAVPVRRIPVDQQASVLEYLVRQDRVTSLCTSLVHDRCVRCL